MSDGVVSRLELRVPQGHLGATRARIEDALSRAGTDERLLLLRSLDFGRMPVGRSTAYWAEAAGAHIVAARSRAVHGTSPGADRADAVWFHSAGEAWMLLLRALASGRHPTAWFWRLAVRGWDDGPLNVWLPKVLHEAARNAEVMVRTAHALVPVIEAGMWAPILLALPPLAEPSVPPPKASQGGQALGIAASEASTISPATVQRLMARLSPGALVAVAAAVRSRSGSFGSRAWLARLVLVAHVPELAAAPAVLAEAANAIAELLLTEPHPPDRRPPHEGAPVGSVRSGDERSPRKPMPATTDAGSADNARDRNDPPARNNPAREHDTTLAERAASSRPEPDVPPPDIAVERESRVAGLFLVIGALSRLGLPRWLDRHPELAHEGFARQLLLAIAARMGAGPDDPVRRALTPDDATRAVAVDTTSEASAPRETALEVAGPDPSAMDAWRVGLDRWLRREARISLSETVRRRGWIVADAERISVRFRLDAADIRLRRRALDIDPGWVPWLGLTVHYVYRDEPRT